ncbi:MAG: hypothetical protein ABIH71_01755 [Candidatus Omnitrophota bacterium]
MKKRLFLAVLVLGVFIVPFISNADDYDYNFYDFTPRTNNMDVAWNLNNPLPASDLSYPNIIPNLRVVNDSVSNTEVVAIELGPDQHVFEYLMSSFQQKPVVTDTGDEAVYKFLSDGFKNDVKYRAKEIGS